MSVFSVGAGDRGSRRDLIDVDARDRIFLEECIYNGGDFVLPVGRVRAGHREILAGAVTGNFNSKWGNFDS